MAMSASGRPAARRCSTARKALQTTRASWVRGGQPERETAAPGRDTVVPDGRRRRQAALSGVLLRRHDARDAGRVPARTPLAPRMTSRRATLRSVPRRRSRTAIFPRGLERGEDEREGRRHRARRDVGGAFGLAGVALIAVTGQAGRRPCYRRSCPRRSIAATSRPDSLPARTTSRRASSPSHAMAGTTSLRSVSAACSSSSDRPRPHLRLALPRRSDVRRLGADRRREPGRSVSYAGSGRSPSRSSSRARPRATSTAGQLSLKGYVGVSSASSPPARAPGLRADDPPPRAASSSAAARSIKASPSAQRGSRRPRGGHPRGDGALR